MKYWVRMNKEELQIALLLMKETELTGVLKVDPDFEPEKSKIDEMIRKKFLKQEDSKVSWNPFVKMIVWSVTHAQSVLKINIPNKALRHIYFYDEIMILLSKDHEEDIYTFYFVPVLPEAIGGLANTLEELKEIMPEKGKAEAKKIPILSEKEKELELTEIISEINDIDIVAEHFEPIVVNSDIFGKHDVQNVVVKMQEIFWWVERKDENVFFYPVEFYELMEFIAKKIVRMHGASIAFKRKGMNV